MSSRNIETRVGAFVLAALAVLVGLVLALGDFSLSPGVRLYADFGYTGGLQVGAPVKISGVRIGRVTGLDILGAGVSPPPAPPVPQAGRDTPPVVRASLVIDRSAATHLTDRTVFAVGTQGLIGESYVEVAPAAGGVALRQGSTVRGVDAPRLYVMTLQLQRLLGAVSGLVGEPSSAAAGGVGGALGRLLSSVGDLVVAHREQLGHAIDDLAAAAADLKAVMGSLHQALGDGRSLGAVLRDGGASATLLHRELPGLLQQAQGAVTSIASLSAKADKAVDAHSLAQMVQATQQATQRLAAITADAQSLLVSVQRGQGTVGGLLTDPQIYDDLKDMLRDLKKNPWKFLWRD